ncbi:hypothetical protein D3C81_442070 [compost metagenome]
MLITKELAWAVVDCHSERGLDPFHTCAHCGQGDWMVEKIKHLDSCLVVRAKLLLEREWPNDGPSAGKGT